MEQLYAVMKKALDKRNITMYKFADITKTDRSFLTKMLKGQRSMTVERLNELIQSIEPAVTADESDEIRFAYIDMNFGIDKFNDYMNLLVLNENNCEPAKSDFKNSIDMIADFRENTTGFGSHTELIKILYAAAYKICSAENKRIYTNIDASLSADIFDYIKEKNGIGDVDIKQIINSDSDLNYSRIIDFAFKFMTKGYNIYYSGSVQQNSDEINVIFPYYFITDEICIFADANLACGYVEKNKKVADIYAKRIADQTRKMTKIVTITQDIMETKKWVSGRFKYKDRAETILEFFFCAPLFMTLDMGYQITKNELPNREYLINVAYEHYQMMKESLKYAYNIVSYEGVRNFTDLGMVSYLPEECIVPLKPESRIEVYKKAIEYYRCDNKHLFIARPNIFKNKVQLEITDKYSDRKHIISNMYGYVTNFVGNSMISINDTDINNELLDFLCYLTVSPYFYSKEESLDILRGEIKRLEYMTESNS